MDVDDDDRIVGHKTFSTGEIDPTTGFPALRHEPLTKREADAIWESAKEAERKRAEAMPDEKAAIRALWDAQQRLKELGWNDPSYCPKDGTHFQVIELGSTGVFDCVYEGEWPDGHWTTFDEHDAYPSATSPAMFKLYPEDQAKHDARLAEAGARIRAELAAENT